MNYVYLVFSLLFPNQHLTCAGHKKTRAVWTDCNLNCHIKWLTWRWLGVTVFSSHFPPPFFLREQSQGWNQSTNPPSAFWPTCFLSVYVADAGWMAKWKMRISDSLYLLYSVLWQTWCLSCYYGGSRGIPISVTCCFPPCFHVGGWESLKSLNITKRCIYVLFWPCRY